MILYAPIIDSSISAFTEETGCVITYDIPVIVAPSEIQQIQVRIKNQNNNQTIYSQLFDYNDNKKITIKDKIFDYNNELFYKIQLRFLSKDEKYSEWSTVAITRAITAPTLSLNISNGLVIYNTTYIFKGYASYKNESEKYFEFNLYKNDGSLLETSGKLLHNASLGYDSFIFKTNFEIEEEVENYYSYKIGYKIYTINGYESEEYLLNFSTLAPQSTTLTADYNISNESNFNNVKITFAANKPISNWLVLRRNNISYDNYWEDIKYLNTWNDLTYKDGVYTLDFKDFIIEHGATYIYELQKEWSNGSREIFLAEEESRTITSYLQDITIYRQDRQLQIFLNPEISSFRRTKQEQVQLTLGSQFPFIFKNGFTNYAEFPIKGTISYWMDDDSTFIDLDNDYGFEQEYFRLPEGATEGNTKKLFDKTIDNSDKNYYVERKFREDVENWLSDGTYKLYKSPTEGSMIIYISNVSLVPHNNLNRLIYDFTATAYEVATYNLENLVKYDIYNVGSYDLSAMDFKLGLGQVAGVFKRNEDVLSAIKTKINSSGEGEYRYNQISEISISGSPYSELIFNGEEIHLPRNGFLTLKGVEFISLISKRSQELLVDYFYSYSVETQGDFSKNNYSYLFDYYTRFEITQEDNSWFISTIDEYNNSKIELDFIDGKTVINIIDIIKENILNIKIGEIVCSEVDLLYITDLSFEGQNESQFFINEDLIEIGPTKRLDCGRYKFLESDISELRVGENELTISCLVKTGLKI